MVRREALTMPDTPADIEEAKTHLQDIFRDAWNIRGEDWLSLGRETLQPLVPEHVKANASKVPVLMPIMRDNIISDVTIGTGNEPEIKVIDQEGTEASKADAEDMRLYYEIQRRILNHGGRIDKATFAHLCWPDGVAVWRLKAERPDEYDGAEEGDAYNRARESYFKTSTHSTFELNVISPRTCAWWPLENPTQFIEDKEVDIFELEKLKNRETGESADVILGVARDRPGTPTDQGQQTTANLAHFTAYEYYDAKEDCYYRCEYVWQKSLKDDGQQLDKIKLPHQGMSYEVVPSGSSNLSEQTDPHQRYIPKLYALGVMVERLNTLLTLEQACVYSQLSDRGVYLSIPAQGLNDDSRRVMDTLFPGWGVVEGGGAEENLVVQLPVRREGELLLMPGIIHTFPGFVSTLQATAKMIESVESYVRQYATNPFLTGRAFAEYREGTSTANSLGTQNSGTVYGPHREQIDSAWSRTMRKMANCMITWDEENDGKSIPYYATTTGGERNVGAGKMVKVDATKARRHNVIKLETLVEMQQERLVRIQAAEHAYQQGRIAFEDLLREDGWDDPHRKAFELAEEGNLYQWQRENEPILMARRQVLTQTILGLNLQAIGQQAAALATPGGGGAGTPPANGGGPPSNGQTPLPQPGQRPGGAPALGMPAQAGGVG